VSIMPRKSSNILRIAWMEWMTTLDWRVRVASLEQPSAKPCQARCRGSLASHSSISPCLTPVSAFSTQFALQNNAFVCIYQQLTI